MYFNYFIVHQKVGMWEVDDIIELELYRNLALALVGVFVFILFFLGNLKLTLLVQLCVTMTLVRVRTVSY